jgi:hypothetical protein
MAILIVSLFLLFSTIPAYSAVFNVPSGNVTALIAAINTANANGEENTINLEPGTYTFTYVDNPNNGLPIITGNITINGEDAETTIIERDPSALPFRIFQIGVTGTLTLSGIDIRQGDFGFLVREPGGAIQNEGSLFVTYCVLERNRASTGGSIYSLGTLSVTHSILTHNTALFEGGAIANFGTATVTDSTLSFNVAQDGGAIWNPGPPFANASVLIIRDSAIVSNFGVHGGGLENGSTMTLVNSTLASNSVVDASTGAIFNTGTLDIANSTIANNIGPDTGGINNAGRGTTNIKNTILALNSLRPTFGNEMGPDCVGGITSLGSNIIGDPTGCNISLLPSDLTGDPGLGDFSDDGTPGNGHFPLLETSRAVDAGNNDVCLSDPILNTDQIGNPRVGVCDIGAIEFQSVLTVVLEVRPGPPKDPVNPKSKGMIPVAIMSTDGFDASTVDQASLRFGPGQALATGRGRLKDLNGDGLPDLVLHFRTQDTGIQCGDTSVSITGQTVNGIPIQGSDSITTVGCKSVK